MKFYVKYFGDFQPSFLMLPTTCPQAVFNRAELSGCARWHLMHGGCKMLHNEPVRRAYLQVSSS